MDRVVETRNDIWSLKEMGTWLGDADDGGVVMGG
jgi:hypothetical protein